MVRCLVSWLVVFVLWMAGSFAVHGAWLRADYAALPNLFRPEAEAGQYFPLMILAHVLMAGAFVWIYRQGVASRPWLGQGLRFGAAVAAMGVVPTYLIYYVVQPMPPALVAKQIVGDGLLVLVLGAVTAALNRPAAAA